jgi:signal peptidase I
MVNSLTEISYCKLVRDKHMSRSALLELARSVLDQNANFRFRAGGGSMSPFIRNNDLITLAPLANQPIRTGDVVAFIHPNSKQLIIHRVVGTRKGQFRLKGDNTMTGDGLIPACLILGKVVDIQGHPYRNRIGLGPGRSLIAFLSRNNLLILPVFLLKRAYHFLGFSQNQTG